MPWAYQVSTLPLSNIPIFYHLFIYLLSLISVQICHSQDIIAICGQLNAVMYLTLMHARASFSTLC